MPRDWPGTSPENLCSGARMEDKAGQGYAEGNEREGEGGRAEQRGKTAGSEHFAIPPGGLKAEILFYGPGGGAFRQAPWSKGAS